MNRFMVFSILYVASISCMDNQTAISKIIKGNAEKSEGVDHCFTLLQKGINSSNTISQELSGFTNTTLEVNKSLFLYLLDQQKNLLVQQKKSNNILIQQQKEIKALSAHALRKEIEALSAHLRSILLKHQNKLKKSHSCPSLSSLKKWTFTAKHIDIAKPQ